jgi:lysozyme
MPLPLIAACGGGEEDGLGTARDPIAVCAGSDVLPGVDVSHYDGTIDWAQVKASGRAFAIAKATEGTTFVDPTFATNWAGMKQAGIVRSAYHFFHANVDPITEAEHFLSVMGPLEDGDLPPTLDLEVTDGEGGATITANTIKWLDYVAAATGTTPILYTSPGFVSGTLGSPAGLDAHARMWVANWGVSCPDLPSPFTTWSFWQYSSTGTVPGIPGSSGAVDLDKFDGNLAALTALTKQGSTASASGAASSSVASSSGSGSSSGAGGASGTSSTGSGHTGVPRGPGHPSKCAAASIGAEVPGPATRALLLAVVSALIAGRKRRRGIGADVRLTPATPFEGTVRQP